MLALNLSHNRVNFVIGHRVSFVIDHRVNFVPYRSWVSSGHSPVLQGVSALKIAKDSIRRSLLSPARTPRLLIMLYIRCKSR